MPSLCEVFLSQMKPEDSRRSSHWREAFHLFLCIPETLFEKILEIKCDCDEKQILKITSIFTVEEGPLTVINVMHSF